ncbi:MAG TPA: mechanosensitive ion channel [Steroidobacteraceae bacterium]|nr:mechanosensitive ion channel [Steroidobacteraceae bacterium]HQW08257.1 mechanosensitive ion channel [Steroidobacteraceae bacterium]
MDNSLATTFAAMLESLWRRLVGTMADASIIGSVTWADLLVAATFLALTVVGMIVAELVVRRCASTSSDDTRVRESLRHVARALGKPLHVLIWASGLYFAAIPFVALTGPHRHAESLQTLSGLTFDLALFVIVFWLAARLTRVLEERLTLWAASSVSRMDDFILPLIGRSLRIAAPVASVILALPLLHLPARFDAGAGVLTRIVLIATLAAILLQAVHIGSLSILAGHDVKAADNLRARTIHTQVGIITKVMDVAIVLLAVASTLMLFEEVRRFGTSLLASAGVAGIILGMAAQRTIANLLAGFQIALAQPIREDDVLIVEGEWGRVEEITLTYVVVRIWDERRLVLPLSYFIEKPFQNWTRRSAERLGSVYIWVDYAFPVEEGRKVLKGIIEGNPLWDGRFWNLVVSDASERTMQLRVLATAKDASTEWDLRCDIREKFIAFIRDRHPESLPQVRLLSSVLSGAATPA